MEGKTLSHFRILEKIGEGGMGVIYKAEDTKLGRTVALKVLPPSLVADEERRNAFIAEARTAAAVTHPHIATIHEVDEVDGTTFIAMELIEGESLREHIGREPLPIKEAARLGAEIAEGIAAAHRANIIHRDLKPENVIVGSDGHARVLDFGLAQLLEKDATARGEDEGAPTKALDSDISGTPAYMSPEQARGKPLDNRTDIFSFGCTLYEMVTGKAPFQGPTASDTISRLLHREPVAATALNPDVPESLQWILNKCLDKDPSQRYQDSRDLAVDLRHVLKESGSQVSASMRAQSGTFPPPPAPVPIWRRPFVLGGAVVVLLAAALILPRIFRSGGASVSSANSLAVFSFENLKDPEDPERLGQILQELVITDLSGVEPVKVLSSQRLYDVQKQLGSKEGALDKERTTEVAIRAGAGKMLTGTLSQLGEKWILAAQLVDVRTGEVVQSKRIDGDDLYTMVDMLTSEIQSDLRIAMPTETQTLSVREKTTHSLEAYKHYLAGVEYLDGDLFDKAAEELQKAIDIDPEFGQAYYKLGIALWWPGDDYRAARKPLEELLARGLYTSENEKRMTEGALALMAQKWSEGLAAFEALTQDFPDDKEAWYGLGEALFHYFGGGRDLEALRAFKQAVSLDPEFRLPYQHIFDVYMRERMHAEALAEAEALLEKAPGDPNWNRVYANAVAMSGNLDALDDAVDRALIYNTTPEERKRLYMQLGSTLASGGEVSQAIAYFKKAAAEAPDDTQLERILTGLLREERKLDEYDTAIFAALARDPDNEGYQGDAREIWRRRWEWEKATAMAESIAVARPDDAAAARRWAWYAVQMGDEGKRRRAMAQATRLHKTSDEKRALYFELSGAYNTMGDFVAAKEYVEKVLALTPEPDASLCNALADAYARTKDLERAQEWADKGFAVNPRNPGILALKTLLAAVNGDFESASEFAEKIGEIAPKSSFYYQFKLFTLIKDKRYAEAEALLEQALDDQVTLDDKIGLLARDLSAGLLFFSERQWDRAERVFRRAVEMGAAPEALRGLAMCLMARGDLDSAERELNRGLKETPRNVEMLRDLAGVYLLRGNSAKAAALVEPLVGQGPLQEGTYSALGLIYAEEGRYQDALAWAEKALAMQPTRINQNLTAWILVSGDIDMDRGAALARESLDAVPDLIDVSGAFAFLPPAEETLGLVAMKNEKFAEAVSWFEKAAEVNPKRTVIREHLKGAQARASGAP